MTKYMMYSYFSIQLTDEFYWQGLKGIDFDELLE